MSLVCVCTIHKILLVQKTKEEEDKDKEEGGKNQKEKKEKMCEKKRREKEDSSVHELVPINCAHKKKDVCVHTKNKNTYYLRHTMHTTALLLLFCHRVVLAAVL